MLFAAVAGFVAFSGGRENVTSAGTFSGAQRPPDLHAEPFAGLHDEEGRALSLKRFQGQVVVMTFLYTTCKDTCPLTAQHIMLRTAAWDTLSPPIHRPATIRCRTLLGNSERYGT